MKDFVSIGVNHRTAPVDVRERLWFSEDEVRVALPQLQAKFFRECVLISTCNRTEVYGMSNGEAIDIEGLRRYVTDSKGATSYLLPQHFYTHTGRDAVRQLFRVASGIDSMMIGDVQILGQVKDAYRLAEECRTLGVISSKLFQVVFHAGKRSRAETRISEGAVSVSYGAVELAGKIYDDLRSKTVLLIGSGKTSELTVKHLRSKRIGNVLVANRTRRKAKDLIEKYGGRVIEFENLKNELRNPDIIISSVNSPEYILTASDLAHAIKERGNKPLLVIDIGVPRNIDPASNNIENVFLHDIDALQVIVDKNLEKRKREIQRVEEIIDEEMDRFLRWQNSLQVIPTIEQLQKMAEEIRKEEVHKHRHRFRPEEVDTLELLTKRIVNKILHPPISNLKNGRGKVDDETMRMLVEVRRLFGFSSTEEKSVENLESEDDKLPDQE